MPEKKLYAHSIAGRKPGESFSFQPVLDQKLDEDEDYSILTDEKPFEYEGIGKGVVQVWKDKLAEIYRDGYTSPAGPIEPVRFYIKVFNLSPKLITKVTANIIYNQKIYRGTSDFDTVELEQEGATELAFFKFNLRGQKGELIFPQSADFENIDYVLNNNGRRKIPRL